jgi:hypothetical protein
MILPRRVHAAETLQYLGGGRRATKIGTDNDQRTNTRCHYSKCIRGAFEVTVLEPAVTE